MCTEQVLEHEERSNISFDWYLHIRNDQLWMGEHPPITMLDAGFLWVFDNQDQGGLNDKYWAVGRNNLPVVSNLWRKFVNWNRVSSGKTNTEALWLRAIEESGMRVGRILPLAFRLNLGVASMLDSRLWAGAIGQLRSLSEFLDVFGVAERLQAGWVYTRSSRVHGTPAESARYFAPFHCFLGSRTRETCCTPETMHMDSELAENCWGLGEGLTPLPLRPGFMSYGHMACCYSTPVVSLAPPTQGTSMDSCWPVVAASDGVHWSCVSMGAVTGSDSELVIGLSNSPYAKFAEAIDKANQFMVSNGYNKIELQMLARLWIAKEKGDFKEVISLYWGDIRARRGRWGHNHSDVPTLLIDLARVYVQLGMRSKAKAAARTVEELLVHGVAAEK